MGVTARIDAVKDLTASAVWHSSTPGEVWALQKLSNRDCQVIRVNLMEQKEDMCWSDMRVLFASAPKETPTRKHVDCEQLAQQEFSTPVLARAETTPAQHTSLRRHFREDRRDSHKVRIQVSPR